MVCFTASSMHRLGLAIFALILCPFASACRGLPAAPARAEEDSEFFEQVTISPPPGLSPDPPARDVVLPGDVLALKTISVQPLDLTDLTVDAEGVVHVSMVGAIEVGGLPLDEAAARIETMLHRVDLHAQVLLRISNPAGHTATVAGSVTLPGVYAISPGWRVADLISKAGGAAAVDYLGERIIVADLEAARLVRDGKILPVSIARALEGNPLHNIRVWPGDLLFVPNAQSQRIAVVGQVREAHAISWRAGLRLTDAVAMAGGPVTWSDLGDIRVVRGPLSHPRVYRADLQALFAGKGHDVLLQPGDVVMVTETNFGSVTDVLERLGPAIFAAGVAASVFR